MSCYLDNASTTPLSAEMKEYLVSMLDIFGNPSSAHSEGTKVKKLVEEVREKITKFMMAALLLIMVGLAVRSVFLEGAGAGISFYLVPDFGKMVEMGIGNVVFAAMSQAFFTLSIGIGSMLIFGSYIDKERKLFGEIA